jgi:hypothetical protein
MPPPPEPVLPEIKKLLDAVTKLIEAATAWLNKRNGT